MSRTDRRFIKPRSRRCCRLGWGWHLKNDNLAEAKKFLTVAGQLDADYFESQFGLGFLCLKKNNPALAKVHLQKSMKLMPTLGGAFSLAESYEKTAETAKARVLYAQVASADPAGNLGKSAAVRARALGGGGDLRELPGYLLNRLFARKARTGSEVLQEIV